MIGTDLQRQIDELTQQVAALRQQIAGADSPFREVFLATVDGKQWQERTMVETASADFTGGRKCTADTQDSAIIELLSNEAVLMEIKGSTSLNEQTTRYVKVGGGGGITYYGKAVGAASGNTVTVHPCDSTKTEILGATHVTAYILSPTDASPTGLEISAGDVLLYTIAPNGTAYLLPVVQGAGGDCLPAPGDLYDVLCLEGSPLTATWDDVRAKDG